MTIRKEKRLGGQKIKGGGISSRLCQKKIQLRPEPGSRQPLKTLILTSDFITRQNLNRRQRRPKNQSFLLP